MEKTLLVLLGIAPLLATSVQAEAFDNTEVREQCYYDLKENLAEIPLFSETLEGLRDMEYSALDGKFSRYYKNISSFGIDVDQPIFETRIFSFGEPTGYIHPPFSPFPTFAKSDKWENPAKQNIVLEEYITDETSQKHFLGCAVFRIESENLMEVTSENYLYDGELISVMKSNTNYKAWYNGNISYNHENKPFVNWKRLFVFPKSTINGYFDRFSVMNAFPSRNVDNFEVLKPQKPSVQNIPTDILEKIKTQLGKENPTEAEIMSRMPDGAPLIYIADENGNITNSIAPEALTPVSREGNDNIFAFTSFYQAIENTFPVFAKRLTLRGTLKFDTLKQIMASPEAPELASIWSTVLDMREITKYALKKEKGEIKSETEVNFYETYISKIPQIEIDATKLLKQIEENKLKEMQKAENLEKTPKESKKTMDKIPSAEKSKQIIWVYLGLGILGLLGVSFAFYKWHQKKRKKIF